MELQIDNYVFVLLAREVLDKYRHIQFASYPVGREQEKQTYVAYKSNSEGFWRLALRYYPGAPFQKGSDYVTTTFIHMKLQMFFEEHYMSLPEQQFMKDFSNKELIEELDAINSFSTPKKYRRTHDDPVFDVIHFSCSPRYSKSCLESPSVFVNYLSKMSGGGGGDTPEFSFVLPGRVGTGNGPVGRTGTGNGPLAPDLLKMLGRTGNGPVGRTGTGNGPLAPDLLKMLGPVRPTISGEIGNNILKNTPVRTESAIQYSNYMDICRKKLNDLAHTILGPSFAADPSFNARHYFEMTKRENVKYIGPRDILKVYSAFVEFFFEHDASVQNKLFSMLFNMGNERFTMDIYETRIKNTLTGQVYILYYSSYIRKGVAYKNIVNIVPQETSILQNGLYSKYVAASPYVYKMFDYTQQCTYTIGESANDCTGYYKFIGNELAQLWPLPLLTPKSGGKRRKTLRRRKSLKRSR